MFITVPVEIIPNYVTAISTVTENLATVHLAAPRWHSRIVGPAEVTYTDDKYTQTHCDLKIDILDALFVAVQSDAFRAMTGATRQQRRYMFYACPQCFPAGVAVHARWVEAQHRIHQAAQEVWNNARVFNQELESLLTVGALEELRLLQESGQKLEVAIDPQDLEFLLRAFDDLKEDTQADD